MTNRPATDSERWSGLGEERRRPTRPTITTRDATNSERWGGLGEERRSLPPN
jgi:hypothetical protein